MNPHLSQLQPYPFERLRHLFTGVSPKPNLTAISLGIGEPRHPAPALVLQALSANMEALSAYPATAGGLALRQACSDWLKRRYQVSADPANQVLPVNGSREA